MKYLLIAFAFISCSKSAEKPTAQAALYVSTNITVSSVTTSKDATGVKFVVMISGNPANVLFVKILREDESVARGEIKPIVAGPNIAYDRSNTDYTRYKYRLAINESGTYYYSSYFQLN